MFIMNFNKPTIIAVPVVCSIGYLIWVKCKRFSKSRKIQNDYVLWNSRDEEDTKFSTLNYNSNLVADQAYISYNSNNNINKSNTVQVEKLIRGAEHSIDLAMHIFTCCVIEKALAAAHDKGIQIRIICCSLQKGATGSRVFPLSDLAIPIRFNGPSKNQLMHHKFCIIDGKERIQAITENKITISSKQVLLTGSANWTHQGLNSNWENIIVTSNDVLVNSFEQEFERMWNTFKENKSNDLGLDQA